MSNIRNNNSIVPEGTPSRPVAPFYGASAKAPAPYPALSFRSSLLKAQQRYVPARSPAIERANGETSLLPSASSAAGLAQRPALPYIDSAGLAAPIGEIESPNALITPASPAEAARPPADSIRIGASPMGLADFPKPLDDNGRGMHWVPITSTSHDIVDRYVKQAKDMKVKWMVILNDGVNISNNDYLVNQLVSNGIMPVMRVYTPNGAPIEGDIEALVSHYRQMGVNYFQLYNEPNLNVENPDSTPNVDKYLDSWIPAAKAVARAGGLPGLGSLAPGGNFDDMEFLGQALDKIKQRGETGVLDKAWLGMHNYTLNHPLDYFKDSNGFMKFRWYESLIKQKLGREMPIIGTEGGTYAGSADDKTFPAVDEAKQLDMVTGAYRYMKNREPYNFAYSYWAIANEAGGGSDPAFTHQALFKETGKSPLVDALKKLD